MVADSLSGRCKDSDSSDSDIEQEAGLCEVAVECHLSSDDQSGSIHHYFTNKSWLPFFARIEAKANAGSGVLFSNQSHEKTFEAPIIPKVNLFGSGQSDEPAKYSLLYDHSKRAHATTAASVELKTSLFRGDKGPLIRELKELTVSFNVAANP